MTFNSRTDPPPSPQHPAEASAGRGTHAFGRVALVVGILSGLLIAWRLVFTPVSARVVCDPAWLAPDGASQCVLRVEVVNRIGTAIPWVHPPLRCEVLEGAGLVTLAYDGDSTSVTLTAGTHAGTVELKVWAEAWPLPMGCSVVLEQPMAMATPAIPAHQTVDADGSIPRTMYPFSRSEEEQS